MPAVRCAHLLACCCAVALIGAAEGDPDPAEWSMTQRASYALGMRVGDVIAENDYDALLAIAGLEDARSGEALLDPTQSHAVLTWFQHQRDFRRRLAQQPEQMHGAAERLRSGEEWLLANAAGEEVVSMPVTGLQYRIVAPGGELRPQRDDRVTVHYTGRLIDGTDFDSSRGGDPVAFALQEVVPGWTQGLQQIGIGGRIELFVHPFLAYGPAPRPGIPANSVLIFDVELLGINGSMAVDQP